MGLVFARDKEVKSVKDRLIKLSNIPLITIMITPVLGITLSFELVIGSGFIGVLWAALR